MVNSYCVISLLSTTGNIVTRILIDHLINQLQKICFNFVWDKKRDKVKRDIMCLPIEEGGLDMISIKHQQKTFLIQWYAKIKLASDPNSPLKSTKDILDRIGYFSVTEKATELARDFKASMNLSHF